MEFSNLCQSMRDDREVHQVFLILDCCSRFAAAIVNHNKAIVGHTSVLLHSISIHTSGKKVCVEPKKQSVR
jgi:hypothetical protein